MIQKFINENLERDISNFERNESLYKRYLEFCEFHNHEALTAIKFNKQLSKFNAGIKHKRMRNLNFENGRQGVRLKPCQY